MAAFYARLLGRYKFNDQTVFSAIFDKQDEDGQMLDEIEIYIKLPFNQNLTESDIGNIDTKTSVETQYQKQELKDIGWRFDKTNSMTIIFWKFK